MSRHRVATLVTLSSLAVLASACTTVPRSSGFLSTYDRINMRQAEGVMGRRLATPPVQAMPENPPLIIELVGVDPRANVDGSINERQRAILVNHFARSLCGSLSDAFAIENTQRPDAYRLRAAITGVRATGTLGAAVSTAVSFNLPIGVRPPIGLGEFISEMEVIDPHGVQVAGMIWAQRANITNSGPRISRIGDAYEFAEKAADDFGELFNRETGRSPIGAMTNAVFRRRDEACDVYGRDSVLPTAAGLIGVGLSPELTDRTAQTRQPTLPPN